MESRYKTIFGKQKNLEIINQVLIPNGVDTELFKSIGEKKVKRKMENFTRFS